ncbi:ATP-binding protein [Yoonia sediminilitoris]|uniref:ATP-binding protein n=1 Tax=Yoonia sediminilitoris TaxID=1286148 RepID=UPI001FE7A044|nr:ATP-binding protein [Yoonia sediminilitoris]
MNAALPSIIENSDVPRAAVRRLANSSLDSFAAAADQRRSDFAQTLVKLAVAVILLVLALGLTVYYLRRLNIQKTRQQRETAETAARMDTVIQTSLDGVIVANEDGNILAFNAAAEKIFGHAAEDVIGKALGPLIVPDHMIEAHDAGMARMKAGGEKRVVGKGRVQLEAKHSSGRLFPVELAIQSAETETGKIFIAFLRDISIRVAAEKELIEARDQALAADRLKSEFLTIMSHEIRTPLNGFLGNLTLMQDTKLNSQQMRYIRNMETSGELLRKHVTDVLDLSRYDVGYTKMREIPMNLASFVQSIVDNQSGMAAKNNTTIEWDWLGPPSNWVLCDPDALQHVLMNLVGNAVKFTNEGCVSITLETENMTEGSADFIFRVSDTGIGIAGELKTRIFDDFVTGSVAYDRNVGGTGLGLGIVRRSVKAMGGEIDVESAPHVGSTFEVRLNLKKAHPVVQKRAKPKAPQMIESLRILIAEDNEINCAVAREMLLAEGHTTAEVYDGAAAVSRVQHETFDLILMDISMPIMDGRSATRKIRNGNSPNAQTPILALTANAMASEQAAFLADGMDGVLVKPLSRAALQEAIRSLVAKLRAPEGSPVESEHQNEMREVLGAAAFDKLRGSFMVEAENLNRWLQLDDLQDLPEIAVRCHKIAGSAAVFGATQYRDALIAVENAADSGQPDSVRLTIGAIESVWLTTKASL